MKKRLLRTFSILLCLPMLCSISVYAAEARASSQISVCSAVLARKSNGNLSLLNNIIATGTMDNIGSSEIVLERYNGSQWVEEGTYTVEDIPEMQTSGVKKYTVTFEFSPRYPESDYRAEVTFYAKDSSGSSTKLITTNTV